MIKGGRKHSIAMVMLLCGMLLSAYLGEQLNNRSYQADVRNNAQHQLQIYRSQLEGKINGDIQLVKGLVALISSHPHLTQNEFTTAAKSLFNSGASLRNIGVAPDMVIRYVYPLQGNEQAVGLDYRKSPEQSTMAEMARSSGKMVLAGPLKLVQGGTGIISRMPVMVEGGAGQKHFWGLISSVLDADRLYEASGLNDPALPFEIAIRGTDGKGAGGDVFFGRSEVFDAAPVLATVNFPNGSWQMAAIPRGGWPLEADNVWFIRLLFLMVALLILMPFLILMRTARKLETAQQALGDEKRLLSESLNKYQRLVDDIGDKFVIYSHVANTGELLYVSDGVESVIGLSREQVLGNTWQQVVDWLPDSLALAESNAIRIISGELDFAQFELRYRHADGSERTMLVSAHPYRDEQGLCIRIDGLVEDISERKQAEKSLAESEEKLRGLYTLSPVGIALTNMKGQYIEYNQAFEEICGYPREELNQLDYWTLTPKKYEPDELRQLESLRTTGRYGPYEKEYIRKDGSLIPIRLNGMLVTGHDNCQYIWSLVEDISEQRRNESRLRTLSQAVEQAGESVIITDPEGEIEYVNTAFSRITGYTLDEVVGKTPAILNSGKQGHSYYQDLWESISRGEAWHNTIVDKRKDGSEYPALMTISPIVDEDGAITHYVGIQQDMTTYTALEEKLRQVQKMEALGTLVGGIAHDFNNMLAGMTGSLYLAKQKAMDMPDVISRLDSVTALGMRAADMIQQLLVFARKGSVEMKPFGLRTFVKEASGLNEASIPENIRFQRQICDQELVVRGDATQIQQLLMNLLNNARDAVAGVESPEITLKLEEFAPDEEFYAAHPDLKAALLAHLLVEDNGCGITEDDIGHIFEPFYTTKEVGAGTGLGLSMAYGAIKGHGGVIEVESRPGKGTRFHVYLPVIHEQAIDVQANPGEEVSRGDSEVILVVDDNADIRETTREVLESLGYRVMLAVDGLDAVDQYRRHHDSIALIIMDVVMPQLGGVKAFERIRQQYPRARVIFATGYDRDETLKSEMPPDEYLILSKPYDIVHLSRVMRMQIEK